MKFSHFVAGIVAMAILPDSGPNMASAFKLNQLTAFNDDPLFVGQLAQTNSVPPSRDAGDATTCQELNKAAQDCVIGAEKAKKEKEKREKEQKKKEEDEEREDKKKKEQEENDKKKAKEDA